MHAVKLSKQSMDNHFGYNKGRTLHLFSKTQLVAQISVYRIVQPIYLASNT